MLRLMLANCRWRWIEWRTRQSSTYLETSYGEALIALVREL